MNIKRIIEIYRKVYTYEPWLLATEGDDGHVLLVREGSIVRADTGNALYILSRDLDNRVALAAFLVEEAAAKLFVLKRLQKEVISELTGAI